MAEKSVDCGATDTDTAIRYWLNTDAEERSL